VVIQIQDLMERLEGFPFDRSDWKFISKAGGGGQAVVQIWALKKSSYAVKIFLDPPPEMSERIVDEARMLEQLNYPSIVRGYGIFMPTETDRSAAIITENMKGGSLSEAIEKKGAERDESDLRDHLHREGLALSAFEGRASSRYQAEQRSVR
jgi:serine/threonine protein kinase